MDKETPKGAAPAAATEPAKWWCNFCNFKTNDQKEYLAHSCAEVLKQQGQTVSASGKNACG